MAQHELGGKVRVVENYNYDTLGAPFKVTLQNGVTARTDPTTGREWISIADPTGLTQAVVRCRALDPRKLSGGELRFLRHALRVPANKVANFLDVSAEHYCRCESGERTLSAPAEKLLRLFAYTATHFDNPEKLLDRSVEEAGPPKKKSRGARKVATLAHVFIEMEIQAVREADSAQIEYVFVRRPVTEQPADDPGGDGCDWMEPMAQAA